MPASQAIQAIDSYVRKCGQDYSQWCTGIAADPVERMLRTHGVAEEGDGCGWISYHCAGPDEARATRDHFIALGMKPATGAADSSAAAVFVFKITTSTRL
jgi:hypothetical protein